MWSEYDLKCEIVKNEQFTSPIILINYKDLQRIFMAAFEHFSHNIPELINSYTDTKADTLFLSCNIRQGSRACQSVRLYQSRTWQGWAGTWTLVLW